MQKRIDMSDGSALDATHVTVANLVRLGPVQYDAVLAWVEGERDLRARAAAAREERQKAMREQIRQDAEVRAAATRQHQQREAQKILDTARGKA